MRPEPVLPESANALRAAGLDPAWREAVILRVAALQHSACERFQHLPQAHAAGLNDYQIASIEAGRLGDLNAGLAAVLAFTDQCVAGPDVTDAAFAAAHAVLTDRQLTTVIVLIGHYMTVARLTGVLQAGPDSKPGDFSREH